MTGQQATTGRQIESRSAFVHGPERRYRGRQEGAAHQGRHQSFDVTRRLAQELVVNEKVNVLACMGITPLAMATAPLATQSKTPWW